MGTFGWSLRGAPDPREGDYDDFVGWGVGGTSEVAPIRGGHFDPRNFSSIGPRVSVQVRIRFSYLLPRVRRRGGGVIKGRKYVRECIYLCVPSETNLLSCSLLEVTPVGVSGEDEACRFRCTVSTTVVVAIPHGLRTSYCSGLSTLYVS